MKLAEIMNMEFSKYFSPKKLGIYSLFLLLSWGLLYTWLVLEHRMDEKVASTLLSSSLIYGCIALSVVFLVIQNKAGAFIELLIIAFWLMVIFVYLIITFTVLLNAMPDIEDLIFYYECYLIIFFGGAPLYLILRMI
ncbi:colistin resistant protein CrrC [Enterobacter roggenkampii]|uniref:colistin resistant protein CrrC n=2 Tax=Enterobacter roggenkampii TaxID=1812935 RepID=UPI0027C9E213|nr:transporter [Enterobacter roggenkampii]MDQ2220111.1 transporter [Enterobacter roggenkampii]